MSKHTNFFLFTRLSVLIVFYISSPCDNSFSFRYFILHFLWCYCCGAVSIIFLSVISVMQKSSLMFSREFLSMCYILSSYFLASVSALTRLLFLLWNWVLPLHRRHFTLLFFCFCQVYLVFWRTFCSFIFNTWSVFAFASLKLRTLSILPKNFDFTIKLFIMLLIVVTKVTLCMFLLSKVLRIFALF